MDRPSLFFRQKNCVNDLARIFCRETNRVTFRARHSGKPEPDWDAHWTELPESTKDQVREIARRVINAIEKGE